MGSLLHQSQGDAAHARRQPAGPCARQEVPFPQGLAPGGPAAPGNAAGRSSATRVVNALGAVRFDTEVGLPVCSQCNGAANARWQPAARAQWGRMQKTCGPAESPPPLLIQHAPVPRATRVPTCAVAEAVEVEMRKLGRGAEGGRATGWPAPVPIRLPQTAACRPGGKATRTPSIAGLSRVHMPEVPTHWWWRWPIVTLRRFKYGFEKPYLPLFHPSPGPPHPCIHARSLPRAFCSLPGHQAALGRLAMRGFAELVLHSCLLQCPCTGLNNLAAPQWATPQGRTPTTTPTPQTSPPN